MELDFNRDWLLMKEDGSSCHVNLPHDAMIHEQRSFSNRNGDKTGFFPGGKYVYKKEFSLDSRSSDEQIIIHFNGVYGRTKLLLNGQNVGNHLYGYTPFDVDITDASVDGQNVLEVIVDNTLVPNTRWYSGSGIYRMVTLIRRDRTHIDDVRINTVCINPPTIHVSCNMKNANVIIIDADGKIVAEGPLGDLVIENANLWSSKTPYLYTCQISTESEYVEKKFGIRELKWSSEKGLTINGQVEKLRGGCIHHDNGVIGACAFKDAEYRKVRILKEAGYNAIRSSHNPCSESLLDACDELGMYVLDEAFDGWYMPKNHHDYSRVFWDEYKSDLSTMVERDYNHPSVIIYSIGNEVSEVGTEEGIKLASEMTEFVRKLDGSRPVTCGINIMLTVWAKQGMGIYRDEAEYVAEPLPELDYVEEKKSGSAFFNALAQKLGSLMSTQTKTKKAGVVVDGITGSFDVLGLNYGQCRYDMELKNHPERILLGTETYIGDLAYNWSRVMSSNVLIGDFCWTAMDYIGEAGIGAWQYESSKEMPLLAGSGAIDILGNADAQNGFQKVVWGLEDIYIGVRPVNMSSQKVLKKAWRFTDAIPSWNWPGYEGEKAHVEVYSNGSYVKLELNGKTLGKKRVKGYRTDFVCKYDKGTLTAISYDLLGKELARTVLSSGHGISELSVKAEKKNMKANGQDLNYIILESIDEAGIWCPAEEKELTVSIEGPAVIQGIGTAKPYSNRSFTDNAQKTYQGRCQIVIRSLYEPGEVTIHIKTADGMDKTVRMDVM